MLIGPNCVVDIQYTLTNDDGETMDQSVEGQPLTYLHGTQGIIPGLEHELTGKIAGADFKVSIESAEAYGDPQPQLVQEVPRDQFPEDIDITVGMQFNAQAEEGAFSVTVTEISNNTVKVDGNHPLAGMNLNFEGKIENVREATEEEITHGHAHGPHGHQH